MKFTASAKEHLAKSVLSPLGFAVGGFLSAHGWKIGSAWLIGYASLLFVTIQFWAIFLLCIDTDTDKDKNEKQK